MLTRPVPSFLISVAVCFIIVEAFLLRLVFFILNYAVFLKLWCFSVGGACMCVIAWMLV